MILPIIIEIKNNDFFRTNLVKQGNVFGDHQASYI